MHAGCPCREGSKQLSSLYQEVIADGDGAGEAWGWREVKEGWGVFLTLLLLVITNRENFKNEKEQSGRPHQAPTLALVRINTGITFDFFN